MRKQSLRNFVIKRGKKLDYYFDRNGRLRDCLAVGEETPEQIFQRTCKILDDYFGEKLDRELCKKALDCLCVGDTDYFFKVKLGFGRPVNSRKNWSLFDFITKIEKPEIIRTVGNTNKRTFDAINVTVCIMKHWNCDKKEYIKKNLPEIKMRVVEKLENSREFTKFGVPVNCLKTTSIWLSKDDTLTFTFELKI